MSVDEVEFRDILNAKVERQVSARLNESITSAIEETVINSIHPATDFMAFRKKVTRNGPDDVCISRKIESGQMDSPLNMRLSNIADLALFTNCIIRRIMCQKSFIIPVSQCVRDTVHDQVEDTAVQVAFQDFVREPHVDGKREPAGIRSLPEQSPSPYA